MKVGKLLLFIVIIGGVSFIMFVGIPVLMTNRNVNNVINNSHEQAKQRKAELIINGVEYAYTSALYTNNANNPTLEQVKNKFNIATATWTDDYVIKTEYFNCAVEVENNNLVVTCLEEKTSMHMTLSN